MNSYTRTSLGIVLIVIITLCGTFVFSKWTERTARLDLTSEGLYTLSDGSQNILDKLPLPGDKPLALKLFYSKELVNGAGADFFRDFNSYYYYVRDLLRSYEKASGGKIVFEEYDPRPFSDAEAEADRLKIRRFNYSEDEAFYFGLAVTSETGGQEAIEFLSPFAPNDRARLRASLPPIEFKVSELIELASRRQRTKVGVLASVDVTGGGMSEMMRQMMAMQGRPAPQPWRVFSELERRYEIENVETDAEEIDPEIGFLIVVHPKGLEEKALYAVDQYVMNGGKLMVFVDPDCVIGDPPPPQNPQNPFGASQHDATSDLNRLLSAWGVRMVPGKFAGDLELANVVAADQRGSRMRFPGWMTISGPALNREVPVTENLQKPVEVLFAGQLEKTDAEGIELTPLVQTTAEGNTFEAAGQEIRGFQGPDWRALTSKFHPGSSPVTIAAQVVGKFQSAFPEGPPKSADEAENGTDGDGTEGGEAKEAEKPDEGGGEKPGEGEASAQDEESTDHLSECREANSLIVVADVDMLTDRLTFESMGFFLAVRTANLEFLLNGLEFLAGSSDLISIRSKGRVERPFDVVNEIERQADLRTQAKVAEINADIQRFRTELSELRSQATEKNVGLLQNEAIEKQRAVEAKIRDKQRELNDVQKSKRAEIESLGTWLRNLNMIGVPIVILAIGIALAINRRRKRALAVQTAGGAA